MRKPPERLNKKVKKQTIGIKITDTAGQHTVPGRAAGDREWLLESHTRSFQNKGNLLHKALRPQTPSNTHTQRHSETHTQTHIRQTHTHTYLHRHKHTHSRA